MIVTYVGLAVAPTVALVVLLRSATAGADGSKPAVGGTFARLLFAIAVMVAACSVAGWLARRVGQPSVVGEILAGILIGPSLFGTLWPAGFAGLFAPSTVAQISSLAQLGVVLFVFMAGLEFNPRRLRGNGTAVAVTSHASVALPALIGVGLAFAAYGRFAPPGVAFLPFALFLGVSMSITALPVMVRILQERNMYRSRPGMVALTCAAVGDVTAWILLAGVVALSTGTSITGVLVIVGTGGLFVLAVVWLVPRYSVAVAERWPRLFGPAVVVVVLVSAATTEQIGIHAIFGAFFLGIACPGDHPGFAAVRQRLDGIVRTLLLPLFFALSGLRSDLRPIVSQPDLWLWCLLICVAATAGKLGGATFAARGVGLDWRTSLQIGTLMNCRGLTELIVLNVGLELGIIDTQLFTIMVIMAVVSTAMTSPLLTLLEPRWAVPRGRPGRRAGRPGLLDQDHRG